jgi:hypothetical protein
VGEGFWGGEEGECLIDGCLNSGLYWMDGLWLGSARLYVTHTWLYSAGRCRLALGKRAILGQYRGDFCTGNLGPS